MNPLLVAEGLEIAGRLHPTEVSAETGQHIGLIGPNGSGKSSLLHALAGIAPAVGQVRIHGRNPRNLHPNERQRLLTFLPAGREIIWPVPAREFIGLALPPATNWQSLADRLELGSLLDRRMDRLSTGERSRVMLVRALAPAPRLLLLDEPLANLDPYWQHVLLDVLNERARSDGAVTVMAIHDLEVAFAWGDRLWLMNERALVGEDSPAALLGSGIIETVFRIRLGDTASRIRPVDRRSSP